MKVIISEDKQTLWGKLDYNILEKTRNESALVTGATDIVVLNSNGFAANDYIIIGNPGDEKTEIKKISSVTNHTITISAGLSFNYNSKSNIYKIGYDKIYFYEDDSKIGEVFITPDYYVSLIYAVQNEKEYSISFSNSQTSTETEKGETVNTTQRLLCSIADLTKREDLTILGTKIIDKIDIATSEVLDIFLMQEQDISDLVNRDILRQPTALLALHYIFMEAIKAKEDAPSMKADSYLQKYKEKITDASNVINNTEDDVKIFGQTLGLR